VNTSQKMNPMHARLAFALRWGRERGLPDDPRQWPFEQVEEMRKHNEWKNPKEAQ